MNNQKIIMAGVVVFIALVVGLFMFSQTNSLFESANGKERFANTDATNANGFQEVKVLQKWELPDVLREVSGIAYLAEGRFACVQDERGIIFIYNTNTAKIEKEIPFAGAGDYEGLAIAGDNAYVVRSDGRLYEVLNFMAGKPTVNEYAGHLTAGHNIEGLCFDKNQNRLLLAIKGKEPQAIDYKGIYAFNLATKTLEKEAVFKLNLKDAAFGKVNAKKLKSVVSPSEIAVHPQTSDIYLTDAAKPKILVLDTAGKIKKVYPLDKTAFQQPEGLTFSPQGDLYISNEGKTGIANILKVEVK